MKKIIIQYKSLWLVLVGLVIVGSIVFTSPHFDKCVQEKQKQNSQQATQEHPLVVCRKCFFVAFHESSSILSALATIVVMWLTFNIARANDLMAIANEKLAGISANQERLTEIHERAYLDAGPGGGDGPIPGQSRLIKDGKMGIRLHFANHGRTPATIKRMCWHIASLKSLPKVPQYTDWLDGGMKVSPNGIAFLSRYYRHYDMSFNWGGEPQVAYGRVEYLDVFKNSHHTSFLLRIVKKDDGFSHPPLREGYEQYWDES